MEKKRLVLTALLALAYIVPSAAQYNYTSAEVDGSSHLNSNGPAFVRKWNSRYSVSVSGNRICILSHSQFLQTPTSTGPSFPIAYYDLPSAITPYDVQILDDSLFFCGQYSNAGQKNAVIGCIPLTTRPNTTTTGLFYRQVPALLSFNKMVLKRISGRLYVAGFGTEIINNVNRDLIFQIENLHSPNILLKRVVIDIEDLADGIVLYGNGQAYFMGRTQTPNGSTIWMRNSHVAGITVPNSSIYTKYTFSPGGYDVNSPLVPVAVDEQTLALAYVGQSSNGQSCARIRVFNVGSRTNTSSYEFALLDKYYPLQATVQHGPTNTVTLLQSYTNPMGIPCTDMYSIVLNITTPSIPIVKTTFSNKTFNAIDETFCLTGSHSSATLFSGDSWYLINNIATQSLPHTPGHIPSYCHQRATHSAQNISNLTTSSAYNPFPTFSLPMGITNTSANTYQATLTNTCFAL